MSMIWAGAVEIALAWAVILGVKIASNAFEWKFEHLLPNYWYPVVKRKLAKPIFAMAGIPEIIRYTEMPSTKATESIPNAKNTP